MHIDRKLLRNLFFCAAGCVVLAWILLDTERIQSLLQNIWDLIAPFAAGAVIAFIFNVPMRAIENQLESVRKESVRRGFSIVLTIAALVLAITFVLELLVPQIRLTIESLQATIPAFVERTAANLIIFMDDNPELKAWILETTKLESLNWSEILKNTLTVVGNSVTSVMGGAVNVIGNVTTGIVNAVISIVFALYCLARKDILASQAKRLLYSLVPERISDEVVRIARLTNVTFSSFISGQVLEACILGVLFAVVMVILKMPYIPLVSVIIAVTALIPVVGAFVGCVVGAFFILVNDPLQALTFIAVFLVIQQLENNLIYPRVVGTSIGLPGMWVLVAVTIGGEVMGVAGMLVMIPLASVLYALLREFTERRIAQRNIPMEKLENPPPHRTVQKESKQTASLRRKLMQIRYSKKK